MKKILMALAVSGIFAACGNNSEHAVDATGSDIVNSTTPPPTSDTLGPIGVMMSDTAVSAADSLVAADSIQ